LGGGFLADRRRANRGVAVLLCEVWPLSPLYVYLF